MKYADAAVVAIGRNEGARLERCLWSINPGCRIIYVDSGSTDGSIDVATALANEVVELDMRLGFTAARARNAGWQSMQKQGTLPEFIQFVDGDCELEQGWLEAAIETLRQDPSLAATFGRLRERFPDRSLYNQMCDDEWNGPTGLVGWCGGNAMLRTQALLSVGGFNPDIIAGEEPDLCLRLAQKGWSIRRIAHPMAIHDAAIVRFSQWWKRCKRSGHAYLEHVVRHRSAAFPQWRRQVLSILFWGAAFPSFILICASASIPDWGQSSIFVGVGFLAYLIQIMRMSGRKKEQGLPPEFCWRSSALTVFTKFAEFSGMVLYLYRLGSAANPVPIEYKELHEKSGSS
jgi:GT2 family glycosyltransferase